MNDGWLIISISTITLVQDFDDLNFAVQVYYQFFFPVIMQPIPGELLIVLK